MFSPQRYLYKTIQNIISIVTIVRKIDNYLIHRLLMRINRDRLTSFDPSRSPQTRPEAGSLTNMV